MIVSHEWIRQFVPHDLSAAEIGEALSRHCVTLDGIEAIGASLAPFVVARVVEAGPHPDSDHLWVTRVDDGSGELLHVVCGAPNVVVGTMYPFARTGTVMPSGLEIAKRKIRGEVSNGMLCSARELGLGDEHHGILALDTDAPPGTPLLEVIRLADWRLDLDVLPNRPDLLSHLGVAREVAVITGAKLSTVPADITAEPPSLDAVAGVESASGTHASVRVEARSDCSLFIGTVISGVSVAESPEWLKRRLESIGQRSINNVVDATNYVLHGLGHPVHAYDLSTLRNRSIVVRGTRANEPTVVTLDGVSRTIPEGTTVICDGERPIALAGVMGGLDTEVVDTTRDVLLELAIFDARFVRRARRAANLNTDASYRFERGVDAEDAEEVARLAAALIVQVAGGEIREILVAGDLVRKRPPVRLRPSRLHRLLGVAVPSDKVTQLLSALGCKVDQNGDDLEVTAPGFRHDLGLEVDLIEEVARLIGFDALPDQVQSFRPGTAPDHPLHVLSRRVRDLLVGLGMAETRPMPFTSRGSAETPRVLNPLADDEPYLRSSILDTLSGRAEYNLSHMQGNLRLFEIGSVFSARNSRLPLEEMRVGVLLMGTRRPSHFTEPEPPVYDAWDAKEVAIRMASVAFPNRNPRLAPANGELAWDILLDHDTCVGSVREVELDRPVWSSRAWGIELTLGVISSDDVAPAGRHAHAAGERASLTHHVRFTPLPTMPAAEFDLALVVPDSLAAIRVEEVMKEAGGELLERVHLFDEFRGSGVAEGHRSLAWRLTWRHPDRTLRDKELEGRRARMLSVLDSQLGVRPRAS